MTDPSKGGATRMKVDTVEPEKQAAQLVAHPSGAGLGLA